MMEQEQEPQRATLTVTQAARVLGISRAAAYEAVKTGRLPSLRLSERRIVVPRRALERLLDSASGAVSVEQG